jgi:hypothetical protein
VDPDSYREVDTQNAQVVELVDTQDLKSCDLNSRIGSTPIPGTLKPLQLMINPLKFRGFFILFLNGYLNTT